jgi:hypothetical protein
MTHVPGGAAMIHKRRTAIAIVSWWLIAAATSHAADINKAIAETEGRKRAAENGLKQIKAKGQPSSEIRNAYAEAATRQNAWLESVCQALEQTGNTAPDVSAAAQSAAASLVEWVNIRNRALGLPELSGAIADSTKKSIAQDLNEIAAASWKDRSSDARKRSAAAASLKERLQWKTFDEI